MSQGLRLLLVSTLSNNVILCNQTIFIAKMSFIFHYVVQMIYLAIEIARNLEGINDRSKEAYTKDHKDEEAKEVR